MGRFLLWLVAIMRHWIALAGGAAVVTALGLYERYAEVDIEARYYTGLLVAFVGWAMHFAWLDERDGRIAAEAKVKNDETNFDCYIDRMAFEDPVDGVCVAYLLIRVNNTGNRASILENWRVYCLPPGKLESEIPTSIPKDGEDVRLATPKTGNEVRFGLSEFITLKSYPKRIEPGDGCRGFLRCDVPAGLPEGTIFIVRFKDVNGREYAGEYDTGSRKWRSDDAGDMGVWPGVVEMNLRTLARVILKHQLGLADAPVPADTTRQEKLTRLGNLVANLAHPKGDCLENELEDEAHDLIRELRGGLADATPPRDDK